MNNNMILAFALFFFGYFLNVFYITVLYHRGLTHRAVQLKPWVETWLSWTGNWVTGLDPKGWSCMHRAHHLHADTEKDPHSPKNLGVFGVMLGQLHSYNRTLKRLIVGEKQTSELVKDIKFNVNFLNRKKLWILPYFLHLSITFILGYTFKWYVGLGYYLGIMSHPIQGWMTNALGHRFGYRNFNTNDDSTNNTMVAWLVVGEGFQNNHHALPQSAKFSVKPWEFDGGYVLCHIAQALGMLTIPEQDKMRPLVWSEETDLVGAPVMQKTERKVIPLAK